MHDPQATAAAEAPLPPLEGEALRDAVIKQVEYYLSRQNLANDYYLVSRMNSELFVPIEVIAAMPKMKAFSVDVAYITNALKGSTQVVVDEKSQAVKPTFKLTRSTIIIRDVPSDVTKEEVIALFAPDVCGPISNVHADVGDTWFVQLEDEEHMRKAYAHIIAQQLRGQPVRARVKSENLLRSIPGGLPAGDGFGRGGGNYVPRGAPMGPYGGFGRGGYPPMYDPNAPPPGPAPGGEYRGGSRGGQGSGYRGGRGNGRADAGGALNAPGGVPLAAGGGVPLVGAAGGAAPVMRRESGGRTGGDEFRRTGGGGGRGGGQGGQGGQGDRRAPGGGQRNKGSPRQAGGASGAAHSGSAAGANAAALPGAAAGGAGSGVVGGGVAGMNSLVQSLSSEKKGTPPPQLGPMNFPPLPSKGANSALPIEAQPNGTADLAAPASATGDSPAVAPAAASTPSASSTLSPSASSASSAPHHDAPRFSDIVAANTGAHSPSSSAAAPPPASVSVSALAPIAAPAPVAPPPAVVQSSLSPEAAHPSHEVPAERASPGLRSWSAVVAKDAPKKP